MTRTGIAAGIAAVACVLTLGACSSSGTTATAASGTTRHSATAPASVNGSKATQPKLVGTPTTATVPASATATPKVTTAQAVPTHHARPHVTPSPNRPTPGPSMTTAPDPLAPYQGTWKSVSAHATLVFGKNESSWCSGASETYNEAKLTYAGGNGQVCITFQPGGPGYSGLTGVQYGSTQNYLLTMSGNCLNLQPVGDDLKTPTADGIPDLCKVS